jgi:uncharacterized protein YxjI
MKMLFQQRMFSWFDSYDIYNEAGDTLFTVEGQLAWGHCLHINDASGRHVATVKQALFSFLPCFDLYIGDECIGSVQKEFSFFHPSFTVDCRGWQVEGDLFEWDYSIINSLGENIATVSKQIWNWTDTYAIDVKYPRDALCALMMVLAIDAEKCSRDD